MITKLISSVAEGFVAFLEKGGTLVRLSSLFIAALAVTFFLPGVTFYAFLAAMVLGLGFAGIEIVRSFRRYGQLENLRKTVNEQNQQLLAYEKEWNIKSELSQNISQKINQYHYYEQLLSQTHWLIEAMHAKLGKDRRISFEKCQEFALLIKENFAEAAPENKEASLNDKISHLSDINTRIYQFLLEHTTQEERSTYIHLNQNSYGKLFKKDSQQEALYIDAPEPKALSTKEKVKSFFKTTFKSTLSAFAIGFMVLGMTATIILSPAGILALPPLTIIAASLSLLAACSVVGAIIGAVYYGLVTPRNHAMQNLKDEKESKVEQLKQAEKNLQKYDAKIEKNKDKLNMLEGSCESVKAIVLHSAKRLKTSILTHTQDQTVSMAQKIQAAHPQMAPKSAEKNDQADLDLPALDEHKKLE